MKTIKTYLIIFFATALLSYNNSFSQTPIHYEIKGKGLSENELATACENFVKMIKTDTYTNNEKLTKEFAKKTGPVLLELPQDFISDRELFNSWLEKNITKTNFKSLTEAKFLVDKMVSSTEKLMLENAELYALINKATAEQIVKIRKPLRDNF